VGGEGTGEGPAVWSPALCPNGLERVFDGYDVTSLLANCSAHGTGSSGADSQAPGSSAPPTDGCALFIEAYVQKTVPPLPSAASFATMWRAVCVSAALPATPRAGDLRAHVF